MMFSALDWVIIAIIGLSVIFGLISGFIRSILSVLVWVGAVAVSMVMGPALARSFSSLTDSPMIQLWCSYAVVFVVSALIGWVIKLVLNLILLGRRRGGIDSLLGASFGAVRGILLVVVLMWFALLVGVNQTGLYQQSRLAPTFASMTSMVAQLFPSASQIIKQTMSSARSGTNNLVNSASGAMGNMGMGGGGQVGSAISAIQSGVSQATSAVKGNLGTLGGGQ